jgi:hypothetical protein
LVFEAAMLVLFLIAVISRFSLSGVAFACTMVAALALLLTPSAREFIARRERQFATIRPTGWHSQR